MKIDKRNIKKEIINRIWSTEYEQKTKWPAFKIALIYLVIGSLWIAFSDKMVDTFIRDRAMVNIISMIKGWVYVLVTGGLLFSLVLSSLREVIQSKEALKKLNLVLEDKVTERTIQLEKANRELKDANAALEEEIVERKRIDEQLRDLNHELENRVRERTSQLADLNGQLEKANSQLKNEIIERVSAYDEIKKAKDEAERANLAKSIFLSNISHEIRTPLNGIIGLTEVTLRSSLDEKQTEWLGLVKKSANALLAIINDILDYTKADEGMMTFDSEPFCLRDVIRDVNTLFEISARQKNIKMMIHIDEDVPSILEGDSVRLRQLLSNTVGNAIKFTEQGSVSIDVSKKQTKDGNIKLQFSICDTGIGIPKEKQSSLFECFNQMDNSYSKQYPGTGLGLAITKRIVEAIGGEIWVESEEGKGSTFFFTLWLGMNTATNGKVRVIEKNMLDDSESSIVKNKKKILVVDDDEVNNLFIVTVLEKYNYEVLSAANGAVALDIFHKSNVDLILMDIQMPVIDGMTVTGKIRSMENESLKSTPIVAMTAYALPSDKKTFLASGMDDYISKPITIDELFRVLKRFFP